MKAWAVFNFHTILNLDFVVGYRNVLLSLYLPRFIRELQRIGIQRSLVGDVVQVTQQRVPKLDVFRGQSRHCNDIFAK
jgi:hypothetical protein